jgi:hypothetical protein
MLGAVYLKKKPCADMHDDMTWSLRLAWSKPQNTREDAYNFFTCKTYFLNMFLKTLFIVSSHLSVK